MCSSHSNSSAPLPQVPQGFLLSEPEPLPILWASASCFCRSWSSFGYDNPCSSFLRSPLKKDCHFRLLSSPKPSLLLLNQSLLFFWKFFLLVLLGFSDVFIVCDRLCSCFCINSVSGICNLCLLILQNSSVFRYSCSVLLSHLVRITEVLVSWAVQTSLLFFIFLLGFFFSSIFSSDQTSHLGFPHQLPSSWVFRPFFLLKTSIWFFQWLCRLLNLLYLTVFRTQSIPSDFILWMFLACHLVCILRDPSHSVLIVCVPVHTILRSAVVAWSRLCSVPAELTNSGAGAPQSHTDTNDKYTCW